MRKENIRVIINANNNKFTVRGVVGNPVVEVNTELTPNNYEEPIDVANDFASNSS